MLCKTPDKINGNENVELKSHIKETSHKPGDNVKNLRLVYEDYRRCYTCDLEFDGYLNLMNHRKVSHPSNKKCRFFPDGKCNYGIQCW